MDSSNGYDGDLVHQRALEILKERAIQDPTYRELADALSEAGQENRPAAESPEIARERQRLREESTWELAQNKLDRQGVSEPTQQQLLEALLEAGQDLRDAEKEAS
jgi:hypothetical protein